MSTLRNTYWIPTLHLNLVRVISATITIAILYLLGRLTGTFTGGSSLLSVIIIPGALLITGLSMVLFCKVAGSMGVPFTGVVGTGMAVAMVVFIAVGDPLIWIVRRYYPEIVPVRTFNIINPRAVILIQRNAQGETGAR
jgi:hypothetical protein